MNFFKTQQAEKPWYCSLVSVLTGRPEYGDRYFIIKKTGDHGGEVVRSGLTGLSADIEVERLNKMEDQAMEQIKKQEGIEAKFLKRKCEKTAQLVVDIAKVLRKLTDEDLDELKEKIAKELIYKGKRQSLINKLAVEGE